MRYFTHHWQYRGLYFPRHCCPNRFPPIHPVWKPPSECLLEESEVGLPEVRGDAVSAHWRSSPSVASRRVPPLFLLVQVRVFNLCIASSVTLLVQKQPESYASSTQRFIRAAKRCLPLSYANKTPLYFMQQKTGLIRRVVNQILSQ